MDNTEKAQTHIPELQRIRGFNELPQKIQKALATKVDGKPVWEFEINFPNSRKEELGYKDYRLQRRVLHGNVEFFVVRSSGSFQMYLSHGSANNGILVSLFLDGDSHSYDVPYYTQGDNSFSFTGSISCARNPDKANPSRDIIVINDNYKIEEIASRLSNPEGTFTSELPTE
jgi:hypothetical protein